jgi:hypothetical protein
VKTGIFLHWKELKITRYRTASSIENIWNEAEKSSRTSGIHEMWGGKSRLICQMIETNNIFRYSTRLSGLRTAGIIKSSALLSLRKTTVITPLEGCSGSVRHGPSMTAVRTEPTAANESSLRWRRTASIQSIGNGNWFGRRTTAVDCGHSYVRYVVVHSHRWTLSHCGP